MIDKHEEYPCDNCNVTSMENNPVYVSTITLERTGIKFTLCVKCMEELRVGLDEALTNWNEENLSGKICTK